jgi:hypothetical protein
MRVPLQGGQHAELRDRLTYGQARIVRAAMVAIDIDKAALPDLDLALVCAYVSSWNVLDLDGNAVGLDTPELAPDDMIQAIALAALAKWKGTAGIPKAGSGSSLTTLPAQRSRRKVS